MVLPSEDYLLVFISLPTGRYPLDRVRLMKGMFLLSEEAPQDMHRLYDFVPYDWGPFSRGVYRDLENLQARGLVATEGSEPYESYRLTEIGHERALTLLKSLPESVVQKLAEVKNLTTSMSFLDLLEYVYNRHPDYAQRSKLRR